MNAKILSTVIGGLDYPLHLHSETLEKVKAVGLVIVFGASDDLIEFRGAIDDEGDCYNGGTVLVDAKGILPNFEDVCDDEGASEEYFARKGKAKKIEAVWAEDREGVAWTYKTEMPHETFMIMDEGEPYCRGIVFHIDALGE